MIKHVYTRKSERAQPSQSLVAPWYPFPSCLAYQILTLISGTCHHISSRSSWGFKPQLLSKIQLFSSNTQLLRHRISPLKVILNRQRLFIFISVLILCPHQMIYWITTRHPNAKKKKKETEPLLPRYRRISSKWTTELNVIAKNT